MPQLVVFSPLENKSSFHDHKVIIMPNVVFILLILGLPIELNRLDLCFIHDFLHLNLFRYVPKLKLQNLLFKIILFQLFQHSFK